MVAPASAALAGEALWPALVQILEIALNLTREGVSHGPKSSSLERSLSFKFPVVEIIIEWRQ